ncbi:MAG: hypothetical protein ACLUTO_05130 [Anaerostipes sp.]
MINGISGKVDYNYKIGLVISQNNINTTVGRTTGLSAYDPANSKKYPYSGNLPTQRSQRLIKMERLRQNPQGKYTSQQHSTVQPKQSAK